MRPILLLGAIIICELNAQVNAAKNNTKWGGSTLPLTHELNVIVKRWVFDGEWMLMQNHPTFFSDMYRGGEKSS
jgi:hypothetical protein